MSAQQFESLADIMASEEARRLDEARAEIAAEKAAWDALSPDDQARAIEAVEAKFADWDQPDDSDDSDDDQDEDQ